MTDTATQATADSASAADDPAGDGAQRSQPRPRLAVWKFASCDGCQLSLLDCEDDLLDITGQIEIAFFPEASSDLAAGPYDISLVEGSVSTPDDLDRLQRIRRESTVLVTLGACATSGGIQALRNRLHYPDTVAAVYPDPAHVVSLAETTPIAEVVPVDLELRGCPIDRGQLIEAISALLAGRPPRIRTTSVCVECKERSISCLLVSSAKPCLGPVTQGGCGALCPRYGRGCYGCFGPAESGVTAPLADRFRSLGLDDAAVERSFRGFSGWSPAFRREADHAHARRHTTPSKGPQPSEGGRA